METLNEVFDTNGWDGLAIALVCVAALMVVGLGVWVTWRDRNSK